MEPTMTPTRTASPRRQGHAHGLTLIDLMCALAVTVVLLGSALPSWVAYMHSQGLRAVTETMETDVQYARTVAMTTDRTVRLAIQGHTGGTSCTMVHLGSASACTCQADGTARCTGDGELLRVSLQKPSRGATLTTVGKSLVFDAGKGTVSPAATLTVTGSNGRSVRQIINILGRVRHCSPDGAAGFARCA
jgi:type IV fimbrial biogenesis protein FimT